MNEDRYTVNSEYQCKITELTEVNNDLDNRLCNTRVATLFVDENLEVRRFTPEVTQVFRIMEQDIGRPLSHISHSMYNVDVVELAKRVQVHDEPIEEDKIATDRGDQFLMRVFPYQIAPDTYSGVVFTFVNTSGLRQAQKDLMERELRMDTLLKVTDAYVLINDRGSIQEINPALTEMTGYSEEEMIGQNVSTLMSDDMAKKHDDYIQHYLGSGESDVVGTSREVEVKCKDGRMLKQTLSLAEMVIGKRHWFVGLLKAPQEV